MAFEKSKFGKKTTSRFGRDRDEDENTSPFSKKTTSKFGRKDDDENTSPFSKKKTSLFGKKDSEEKTSTFSKKKFSSEKESPFSKSKGISFSNNKPLGKASKIREIEARLSDINTDMKGILTKLIGDQRDRRSSEDIRDYFNGLDLSGFIVEINYDESIQMCPAFSISTKGGGSISGREGFGKSGLKINGKSQNTDSLEKYSMTSIGNKIMEVIKCFKDVENLLENDLDKPMKIDFENTTISVMGGKIILTPSSMLLNSLKNDLFKVSL